RCERCPPALGPAAPEKDRGTMTGSPLHSDARHSEAFHPEHKTYVLDTNVLIHDPNAVLNFEEHQVIIPMTVLEDLDQLKSGKQAVAADCRQAIRLIDRLLGDATPKEIEAGVPIRRESKSPALGTISILMNPDRA